MSAELTVLALAALLQVGQMCLYSYMAIGQVGPKTALKPRDDKVDLTGTAGRIFRAMNNTFEALILFTIAVLVVTLAGKASGFTALCAWVYLGARVLYVPAYAFGWVPWRSFIWTAGLLATVLILLAALI